MRRGRNGGKGTWRKSMHGGSWQPEACKYHILHLQGNTGGLQPLHPHRPLHVALTHNRMFDQSMFYPSMFDLAMYHRSQRFSAKQVCGNGSTRLHCSSNVRHKRLNITSSALQSHHFEALLQHHSRHALLRTFALRLHHQPQPLLHHHSIAPHLRHPLPVLHQHYSIAMQHRYLRAPMV